MAGGGGAGGAAGPGRPRVVVAITGARGAGVGVRVLEVLRDRGVETHLVMCGCSAEALLRETGRTPAQVRALADQSYHPANQAARISSGSFLTRGMVVAPCSSRSLASIATGLASNLVHRAADVTLKEGRPLVVLIPEPLGPIHEESARRLAEVPGAVVRRLPEEEPALDRVVADLLAPLGLVPTPDGPGGRPAPAGAARPRLGPAPGRARPPVRRG